MEDFSDKAKTGSSMQIFDFFLIAFAHSVHKVEPQIFAFIPGSISCYLGDKVSRIVISAAGQTLGKVVGAVRAVQQKRMTVDSTDGNLHQRESKEETVRRAAERELKTVEQALKKMKTQPAACRADAEKNIEALIKRCKACTISDITYEEVKKHAGRGRPKADAPMTVVAVRVSGKVAINEEYIRQKLEEEIQFVIATTDTKREWTMAELLSTYKRQSTIERMWKISKDPKILLNALYLKTPRRIQALMWVLSIARLVFAATEYLMKKAMKDNSIKMPSPDHRMDLAVPTLLRFKQYVDNSHISLLFSSETQTFKVVGITDVFAKVITAMGQDWVRYYVPQTYRNFYSSLFEDLESKPRLTA